MIAVLSLYQTNYESLAKLTLEENRLEYCATNAYMPVFREFSDMPGAEVPAIHKKLGYAKLAMILEQFKVHGNTEWAWFLDCDAMVTNMTVRLEKIIALSNAYSGKTGILLSTDCHGPNAGSALFRNCSWVRAHLENLLENQEKFLHEQDAFKYAIEGGFYDKTRPLSLAHQRMMNSYDYALYPDAKPAQGYEHFLTQGAWQPGDFVIHWPGRTLEQRLEHYKNYAEKVVR